jgi:hypothetical protein
MTSFLSPTSRAGKADGRQVRLSLESLEAREVPSASPIMPVLPAATALFSPASSHASPVGALSSALHQVSALPPITINSVTVQNGALTANGTIGKQAFSTALTITASSAASAANTAGTAAAAATTTPILNLHLAPIDLNLLGLEVKTSEICLAVSATSGPGNLLGNLLGGVANSLNGGSTLGSVVTNLTNSGQLSTLTTGLTGLLNGALGAVNTAANATPSANDILHLSLGPVNLSLLGLNVNLDNCAGGPITVDVIDHTGPGLLLGNLVSDVSHLFDNLNLPTSLTQRLDGIAQLIVADAGLLGL